MRQLQPVVWSKGVFLSPQHLQAQDRFFEDKLRFLSGSLSFRNWGFAALQIDAAGLSQGRLNVLQASGIFPTASCSICPRRTRLLPRARLKNVSPAGRTTCAFFLAIPQDRPGGINVALQRGGVKHSLLC